MYIDTDILKSILLAICGVLLFGILIWFVLTPEGIKEVNEYEAQLKDTDYNTDYDSVREIEETLRSYMASYEADRIIYETNKNNTDKESVALANAAKSRANRTAATYNQFYLKNSYIWKDNIPEDIKSELEYIQ